MVVRTGGRCIGWLLLAFLSAVFTPAKTRGAPGGTFTEDFRSYQYRDATNTTAEWDTAAGEIRLPAYRPSVLTTLAAGDARSVSASGTLVAVADAAFALRLYDVSDPVYPVAVGTYAMGTAPVDVQLLGSTAYVAATTGGLRIVDVSTPSGPVEIGAYGTVNARAVWAGGGYAYVADFPSGVIIVDVSDPASPVAAGSYATGGFCSGVAVTGDYAYAATGANGLVVLDVSDPSSPDSVGGYAAASVAQHVAVDGDLAFVADGLNGLVVLDIANRASPVRVDGLDTADFARHVAVSGRFVMVSDVSSGVVMMDATAPGGLAVNSTLSGIGPVFAAAVDGPFAYLANGSSGLTVARFGAPVDPVAGGGVATPDTAAGLCLAGRTAYVAAGSAGLRVLDLSALPAASEAGYLDTPGFAAAVDVSGVYAYVADGPAGLRIVDVSVPGAPVLAASVATPGSASGVSVSGDYAFVADGSYGLQVVDVVDPPIPVLAGGYVTPGNAIAVVARGELAYLAAVGAGNSGLTILDVSEPATPQPAGDLPLAGDPVDIAVHGDWLFALTATPSVVTVEVSDPTAPVIAGEEVLAAPGGAVAVSGARVYVGGVAGLTVLDASNPIELDPLGTRPVLSGARDVVVSGEYALAADGAAGFRTVQVHNFTLDTGANAARSVSIHSSPVDVVSARLSATQTDSVRWEISADGGTGWDEVVPGGNWVSLSVPGGDLRWRSTHRPVTPGVNPSCSGVEIEWLGAAASIDSVRDVPGDDGGWVRLFLTRSGYDIPDPVPEQIAQYIVYRRVDAAALGPESAAAAEFPPGVWEIVGYIPALQQDQYVFLAPTITDSVDVSSYSVFVVSAHTTTPAQYYVSAPDSGYSVDNSVDRTPPDPPACLTALRETGVGNRISWCANDEPDFLHYRVYRDTLPGFVADANRLVHQTFDTTWTDPQTAARPYYYRVSAVDTQFNESATVEVTVATGAEVSTVARFRLHGGFPNPFGRFTKIRFELPRAGARVDIGIYDAAGRRVRSLVSGFVEGGKASVVWDGTDRSGGAVASGVYLCRMRAPGFDQTRKLTVLR